VVPKKYDTGRIILCLLHNQYHSDKQECDPRKQAEKETKLQACSKKWDVATCGNDSDCRQEVLSSYQSCIKPN
jgi:hypothetical protein